MIEEFGGAHDIIGGKLSGLYDDQGNIKREMAKYESTMYDDWAAVAILPASPFAAAELLPPEVWIAIAVILRAAR